MIDCTVLIMTFNEERNIKYCLDSVVGKFKRVCVVDSFSNDNTEEIIRTYPSVEVFKNQFESWATQRNWLFQNSNVQTEYVLFLDADELISNDLFTELDNVLGSRIFDNIKFNVRNIFLGKVIKYSYGHPPIVRIFRSSCAPYYQPVGAREYPVFMGKQFYLKNPLMHQDHRPIEDWFRKHISNAKREAQYIIDNSQEPTSNKTIKDFIRNNIWVNLPIFFRGLLYFFYRYILKGGFLDGKPGFIYCFFQAYSYQLMISTLLYANKVADHLKNE